MSKPKPESVEESRAIEPLVYKPSQCFKGLVFYILGAVAGYTSGKMTRLIKDGGGKVTKDYTNDDLTSLIIAPAVWSVEGTAAASMIIKNVRAANLANENASPDDPDAYRVWFLDLEWVIASLESEEALDEEDFDLERCADKVKAERRKKAAKLAAKEKKANGGVSKYGPGERAKALKAQRVERDIKAAKEDAEVEAEARAAMAKQIAKYQAEQIQAREKLMAEYQVKQEERAKEIEDERKAKADIVATLRRNGTYGTEPDCPPIPSFLDSKLYAPPILRRVPAPPPIQHPNRTLSIAQRAQAQVGATMLRIQRANAAALAAKNRQNGTPIKPILDVPIAPALSSAQAQAEADVARARAKKAARKAEDVARQARMTATMAKMADQRATGGMGQGVKRENPADPGSAAFHKRQSAEKKKAAESRREALMGRTNVGGPPAIPVAGNGVASGSGSSASSANGGNNRMDLDPKKMGGTITIDSSDEDEPFMRRIASGSSVKRKSDEDGGGGKKSRTMVLSSDEDEVPFARMT